MNNLADYVKMMVSSSTVLRVGADFTCFGRFYPGIPDVWLPLSMFRMEIASALRRRRDR